MFLRNLFGNKRIFFLNFFHSGQFYIKNRNGNEITLTKSCFSNTYFLTFPKDRNFIADCVIDKSLEKHQINEVLFYFVIKLKILERSFFPQKQ